jgi:hypothetical protein
MSTETAPPAAPTATPPPAAPAKSATPPIPAAQAASVPPPSAAPVSSRQPKDAPNAPPTIDADLKKLAADMLTPKPKVKAEVAAEKSTPEVKADAPAAPEAKTDKPVPADKEPLDIPEPKGMTPENLANWKTWREQAKKEINEARNEKAALAAKLKTYETATPADNEKTARLEARTKELEDKLAIFDIKSHPDFVKQYVEPRRNALKEAGEIVAYNGKEGVDLNAILELPQKDFNAKVSELTKDMNGMDATTVQSALRQAHKLTAEEKGALSQAGELKKQLESKAAFAARQGFEESKTEFTSRIPEMAIPEGADADKIAEVNAYNSARQAALVEAEKFTFGKMSEREVAGIATRAASLNLVAHHVLPAMQRDLKRSNELLAQATAELAAIKKSKAAPAFTGGKDAAAKPASNLSFQELAEQMLVNKRG